MNNNCPKCGKELMQMKIDKNQRVFTCRNKNCPNCNKEVTKIEIRR